MFVFVFSKQTGKPTQIQPVNFRPGWFLRFNQIMQVQMGPVKYNKWDALSFKIVYNLFLVYTTLLIAIFIFKDKFGTEGKKTHTPTLGSCVLNVGPWTAVYATR